MAVATITLIIKVQNTGNDHADKYVYSSCSPYFLPNLENDCLCAAKTCSVLKCYLQLWTWDTALHCLHGLLETANMGSEINIHHLQAAYTSCVKLDFPQDVLSTVFDRSVGCMHSKHILHLIKAHLHTHTHTHTLTWAAASALLWSSRVNTSWSWADFKFLCCCYKKDHHRQCSDTNIQDNHIEYLHGECV